MPFTYTLPPQAIFGVCVDGKILIGYLHYLERNDREMFFEQTGEKMSVEKLLEIGLSGWIIFIITILFGGVIVHQVIKRRVRQSNIKAGGDVAGGDIIKGKGRIQSSNLSSKKVVIHSVQENIVAKGDVASGDIIKDDE